MTDDIPPIPVSPDEGKTKVSFNDIEIRARELQDEGNEPVESWLQALNESIEAIDGYDKL